jgi:hypothetical protein
VAAHAQDCEKVVDEFFTKMPKILPEHKPVPRGLKKKKKQATMMESEPSQ